MGGRGIRGLKARVERKCCISREGRWNSGGIQDGKIQGGSYGVVSRRSRGKFQE